VTKAEREKNAADNAKEQTHDPEGASFRQRRNSGNRNRDLEHGHAPRKNFVLMKIRPGFRLFVLRFRFDFFLLFFVTIAFGRVGFAGRGRKRNFRVEHRSFDALGLVITPLIGRFDLAHHRFIGVFTGKQSRDRSQHRQDRGT